MCQSCSKGWILRYSSGQGYPLRCVVTLYVGEGYERELCCLLQSLQVFSHFPCYIQSNWALLVLIPGWGGCVCSKTLWVSPATSCVRLGVFPTVSSTPTGVFSQRLEALFPCWNPGLPGLSCSPVVPPGLSKGKCRTTQPATHCLAESTRRHLACQLQLCLPWSYSHHLALSPLRPAAHLCPSYQSG